MTAWLILGALVVFAAAPWVLIVACGRRQPPTLDTWRGIRR